MSIHTIIPGQKYRLSIYGRRRGDGSRPRITETFYGDYEAARSRETELKYKRDRGKLAGPNPALGVYLDEYLDERESEVAPKTMAGWRYHADNHIKPRIGALDLDEVTPPELRRLYREMQRGGLSGTTTRAAHRLLHLVFKQAVGDGLLPSNPCQFVKPPPDDTPEKRTLDEDAVGALLKALPADTMTGMAARLALGTGMRRAEVLALTWDKVDFGALVVNVTTALDSVTNRPKATKTKRGQRTIPISRELAADLKRHKAWLAARRMKAPDRWTERGIVFPSLDVKHGHKAGRYWTPAAFSAAWRKAGTGWSFHELRHTCITRWLRAGMRDELVSRLAGHSGSNVTRAVYSHAPAAEFEEARAVVDGIG